MNRVNHAAFLQCAVYACLPTDSLRIGNAKKLQMSFGNSASRRSTKVKIWRFTIFNPVSSSGDTSRFECHDDVWRWDHERQALEITFVDTTEDRTLSLKNSKMVSKLVH